MRLIKKGNLLFGVGVCSLGYFFSAMVGACSKLVGAHVSVLMILFFQSVICLLFSIPTIYREGFSSLKTKRIGLHFTRDFTSLASFFCLFASLTTIPLVNAMLLSYTEPLWIPFVSLIWPGIRMKGYVWWGILLGLLGVVLILQPKGEGFHLGAILALLSGAIATVTLIATHRLSSTEPTQRILFYNSLFGMILTAPFFFYYLSTITLLDLPYLIGAGLFTYISLFLITHSFQHGNPTMLGYFAYTVILFSGLLGWLIWKEAPNFVSFIGMATVVFGGVTSVYFEKRYQREI